MTLPRRPGNDLPDRHPFLGRFEKGCLYTVFTIAAAGFIGLTIGLIITAG